jgi:hypothetical protein
LKDPCQQDQSTRRDPLKQAALLLSKRNQFSYVALPVASAHLAARRAARRRLLRLAQARRRLLRLRRASGCLGTSRGSSRGSSRHSSSSTPPRAGSSSTTSPTPCDRVPRHVARLIAWLVVPLVVDYSASRRLVVDYFASAARPGASACHADRRAARRRLLRLRRASGCLGTSHGTSLFVDYFAYAARPGASARRAAHRVARCAARRRLLHLA